MSTMPPETAPAADWDAAGAAASERIAATPIDGIDAPPAPPETAPAAPPAAPPAQPPAAPPTTPAQPPSAVFDAEIADDAPYRDVKGVRDDLAKAREVYKPYAEVVDALPEDAREVVRGDFAPLAGAYANLTPAARAEFVSIMAQMPQNPVAATIRLSEMADQLRDELAEMGQTLPARAPAPETPATPAPATPDGDLELDDDVLTRAEADALVQQRVNEILSGRDQAAEEERIFQGYVTQAKELGYDPESTDPVEMARASTLFELAALSDGSLTKAHESIQAWEQGIRDEYARGKSADADRVIAPDGGAPPSEERVLETTQDAEAAMRARLDAELGPARRRG